jgi:hypothetical protein
MEATMDGIRRTGVIVRSFAGGRLSAAVWGKAYELLLPRIVVAARLRQERTPNVTRSRLTNLAKGA